MSAQTSIARQTFIHTAAGGIISHNRREINHLQASDGLGAEVLVSDNLRPDDMLAQQCPRPAERREVYRAVLPEGVANLVVAVALADHGLQAVRDELWTERVHAGGGRRSRGADRPARPGGRRTDEVQNRPFQRDGQFLPGLDRRTQPLMRHVTGGVDRPIDEDFIARLEPTHVGICQGCTQSNHVEPPNPAIRPEVYPIPASPANPKSEARNPKQIHSTET
jgi:hypothetical protein